MSRILFSPNVLPNAPYERPYERRYERSSERPLANRQHPIESKFSPLLLLVRHDDFIDDLAVDNRSTHPQKVVRRNPEHRRAQPADMIEPHAGLLRRLLFSEAIHDLPFRRDPPLQSNRKTTRLTSSHMS